MLLQMQSARGFAIVVGVLSTAVLAMGQTADSPDEASTSRETLRDIEIDPLKDTTEITLDVAPHEKVLVAYTRGLDEPAYPFRGIVFPAKTETLRLMLEVKTPEWGSQEDYPWKLLWGVWDEAEHSGSMKGGPIPGLSHLIQVR